jgi:hypothetical protein
MWSESPVYQPSCLYPPKTLQLTKHQSSNAVCVVRKEQPAPSQSDAVPVEWPGPRPTTNPWSTLVAG